MCFEYRNWRFDPLLRSMPDRQIIRAFTQAGLLAPPAAQRRDRKDMTF